MGVDILFQKVKTVEEAEKIAKKVLGEIEKEIF